MPGSADLAWGACRAPDRAPPRELERSVAIETHLAGEPFGWVHAALDRADGCVVVRAGVCSSRRELWAELERIAAAHRGVRILYPEGFRHHVPRIAGAGETEKVTPADTFAAYAATRAAIRAAGVAHAAQAVLTEQVLAGVAVTVPDRGATLSSRASSGPIYLARALVWSCGRELRPDQTHRAVVVAG